MIAFPLSLLAFAAGVYLLIKVKREGLGRLYAGLSVLVLVLSLLFMLGAGIRMWHHRMAGECKNECHQPSNKNLQGHGNCGDYTMAKCKADCSEGCDKSCKDACESKGGKDACCMGHADSLATCADGKGNCCADNDKGPKGPKGPK